MRVLLLPVRDDRYALPLEQVSEVVEAPQVTALPHAPPDVLGVTNLRGAVVPVLDTGALLGLGALGSAPYAAVAESEYGQVALAASGTPDAVELGRPVGEAQDRRALGRFDLDGRRVATLLDLGRLVVPAEA